MMKGIRFYLEYPSKKEKRKGTRKEPGNHLGQVVAVMYENGWWSETPGAWHYMYDCISALTRVPNSVVCGSSVSWGYLDEKCKRISEKQAREIHPNLFIYLEA